MLDKLPGKITAFQNQSLKIQGQNNRIDIFTLTLISKHLNRPDGGSGDHTLLLLLVVSLVTVFPGSDKPEELQMIQQRHGFLDSLSVIRDLHLVNTGNELIPDSLYSLDPFKSLLVIDSALMETNRITAGFRVSR